MTTEKIKVLLNCIFKFNINSDDSIGVIYKSYLPVEEAPLIFPYSCLSLELHKTPHTIILNLRLPQLL